MDLETMLMMSREVQARVLSENPTPTNYTEQTRLNDLIEEEVDKKLMEMEENTPSAKPSSSYSR